MSYINGITMLLSMININMRCYRVYFIAFSKVGFMRFARIKKEFNLVKMLPKQLKTLEAR